MAMMIHASGEYMAPAVVRWIHRMHDRNKWILVFIRFRGKTILNLLMIKKGAT